MKTPSLLAQAEAMADQPGTCLLYSGGEHDAACRTYLGLGVQRSLRIESASIDPWTLLEEGLQAADKSKPWMGYLAYEMGASSDPIFPLDLPMPNTPLALFYQAETFLSSAPGERIKRSSSEKSHRAELLEAPDLAEAYCVKVRSIQDRIRAGDVYQVNLSQRFRVRSDRHPYAVFQDLAHLNPAPFMSYMHCGDHVVISSSPERFLKKTGRELETRPIKGTRPRGATPEQDALLRAKLLRSEKDRSELLMITDLMRNDLGRVAEIGTVHCPELFRCEAYQNVFHMLSIIRARARSDLSALDILRSTFPGGSITGCPKLSAMQEIAALEKRSRGIYTGSIGYFTQAGDFDFNIAIRTLLWKDGVYELQLGGAVVIDSNPRKEYEETLHKGASVFQVLGLPREELLRCAMYS